MKLSASLALAAVALSGSAAWGQAQAPAASRVQVAGIVTAVDASANQITLKNAKGETVTITTNDKTQMRHAPPGETDTHKWPAIALSDVNAGDEAVAMYKPGGDEKNVVATSFVVRTKGDMSQMAQKQLDDWKKRGTTGNIVAVNTDQKTFTIKSGQKTYTVQPSEKTEYHRYSLDSAKVSDAKAGTYADLKPGDQVNVLGNKSADGNTIMAENVYAGTFRQIAATIVSIDTASGEMKVTDLATKKPLVIKVTADSTMKKLPEQMAQSLARRYGAAARGGAGGAGGDGEPGGGMRGGGMRGGGMRGGGGDFSQMLEHLPALPLSDLKPKDAIMVSTTQGTDPGRVTAIVLLAGVEPILTAAPNATRDIMSGWNLGGGGGEGN